MSSTRQYDYHIIVIGAGSGGLVVASGAVGLGAKVALIESEKMGGDCLNAGCVPSKTFLKSAHLAEEIKYSRKYGIISEIKDINLKEVMDRVRSVIKEIEPHDSKERYEELGVKVYFEKGELVDRHTVKAGNKSITGKYIVIATGSAPVIPSIKGLETVDYLTNRNVFDLEKLPEHLIVLGGGPIGLELGQGFSQLGSRVTVIDRGDHLFKKDDPEVAPIIEKQLKEDGVSLVLSSKIIEIKKGSENLTVIIEKDGTQTEISGDKLLVSLGRSPVTQGLGLDKAGIITNKRGYVTTNPKLQTNINNIYACGDVTGPYQFTHMAGYQAGIIIRNTIFRLGAKVNYSVVPWTTYTKPEVAHVGYTEPWAKSLNLYNKSIIVNLNEIDRAKSENDTAGFLKIILGRKNRVIGATLVGGKAGEMIPVATLAITKKMNVSVFMSMIFSYPTEAEIFKFAALDEAKKSLKPWVKSLIQKVFL